MFYLGSACRNKVLNYLREKFKSPVSAEKHFPHKQIAESQSMSEIQITPELQRSPDTTPSQELHIISSIQVIRCIKFKHETDFLELAVALRMAHKHCQLVPSICSTRLISLVGLMVLGVS